jgi:hypothetical protein
MARTVPEQDRFGLFMRKAARKRSRIKTQEKEKIFPRAGLTRFRRGVILKSAK